MDLRQKIIDLVVKILPASTFDGENTAFLFDIHLRSFALIKQDAFDKGWQNEFEFDDDGVDCTFLSPEQKEQLNDLYLGYYEKFLHEYPGQLN